MNQKERLATLLTALEEALELAEYMWAGTDYPFSKEKARIEALREYAQSERAKQANEEKEAGL